MFASIHTVSSKFHPSWFARIPDDPEEVKHVCFQCRMLWPKVFNRFRAAFVYFTQVLHQSKGLTQPKLFVFNDDLLRNCLVFDPIYFYATLFSSIIIFSPVVKPNGS